MSCNAIATARASVSNETLAKLLTDELVSQIVFNYLRLKHKDATVHKDSAWAGVDFVMDGYRIHILNGSVKVTGGWNGTGEKCAEIANDVMVFLTKAAGMIFQSRVRHAIVTKYGVSDEQRAPGGAIVLSVEL